MVNKGKNAEKGVCVRVWILSYFYTYPFPYPHIPPPIHLTHPPTRLEWSMETNLSTPPSTQAPTHPPGVVDGDQVEHELGGVEVHGAGVAQAGKVREGPVLGPVVDDAALRQQNDVCNGVFWGRCWSVWERGDSGGVVIRCGMVGSPFLPDTTIPRTPRAAACARTVKHLPDRGAGLVDGDDHRVAAPAACARQTKRHDRRGGGGGFVGVFVFFVLLVAGNGRGGLTFCLRLAQ